VTSTTLAPGCWARSFSTEARRLLTRKGMVYGTAVYELGPVFDPMALDQQRVLWPW
jgi:hypothetical protein